MGVGTKIKDWSLTIGTLILTGLIILPMVLLFDYGISFYCEDKDLCKKAKETHSWKQCEIKNIDRLYPYCPRGHHLRYEVEAVNASDVKIYPKFCCSLYSCVMSL